MKIFSGKFFIIFLFFAQNFDCGYMLEAVLMSTHNLCFGTKISKISIPLQTPVLLYIKVGYEGVYFSWTCFPDELASLPLDNITLLLYGISFILCTILPIYLLFITVITINCVIFHQDLYSVFPGYPTEREVITFTHIATTRQVMNVTPIIVVLVRPVTT